MKNLLPYLDTVLRRITPLNRQHQVVFHPADVPHSGNNSELTVREAEIMYWVRLGKTNAEIAAILDISSHGKKTFASHLQKTECL